MRLIHRELQLDDNYKNPFSQKPFKLSRGGFIQFFPAPQFSVWFRNKGGQGSPGSATDPDKPYPQSRNSDAFNLIPIPNVRRPSSS